MRSFAWATCFTGSVLVSECIKTSGILWPSAGSNHNTSIFSLQNHDKTGICRYLLFLFYLKHLKTWAARYKWSLEAEGRTIISFLWSDGGTAEKKNCTNDGEPASWKNPASGKTIAHRKRFMHNQKITKNNGLSPWKCCTQILHHARCTLILKYEIQTW